MSWFRKTILLTLIDDNTGKIIAVSNPISRDLPESFAVETILHLGDQDWSVVHANPITREEAEKLGRLTLRLRKPTFVDASKVLYSLPTIYAQLPEAGDDLVQEGDCLLHEDDWRQLEFVISDLTAVIEGELNAIGAIYGAHYANRGFDKMHMRQQPAHPLSGSLLIGDLMAQLGPSASRRGLAFDRQCTRIRDGFSLAIENDLLLYGLAPNSQIKVLCVVDRPRACLSPDILETIVRLCARERLLLVSWCRCECIEPNMESFHAVICREADRRTN